MADGTGAVDAGAGAATTGAATDGAAAAAGAADTATTGAQGTGTGAGTAAVAAAQAAWYGELDADSKGWLQNKQYFGADLDKADVPKSFPEFVKAARGLEKLVGDPNNRVIIPKDINDKEGWDAFYAKVGRPADPSGYELKAPEGGDQALTDSIAAIAFKHGLTKGQVQGLLPELTARANEAKAAQEAAAEQAYVNTSAAEFEALRQSWGGQADHKMAAAQRAKVALGLEPEIMNKMERAIGTTQFVEMLADVGMAFSEDAGSGGGAQGFSTITPQAARARMTDLKADKEWTKRYFAGGAAEKEEWEGLELALAKAMR